MRLLLVNNAEGTAEIWKVLIEAGVPDAEICVCSEWKSSSSALLRQRLDVVLTDLLHPGLDG